MIHEIATRSETATAGDYTQAPGEELQEVPPSRRLGADVHTSIKNAEGKESELQLQEWEQSADARSSTTMVTCRSTFSSCFWKPRTANTERDQESCKKCSDCVWTGEKPTWCGCQNAPKKDPQAKKEGEACDDPGVFVRGCCDDGGVLQAKKKCWTDRSLGDSCNCHGKGKSACDRVNGEDSHCNNLCEWNPPPSGTRHTSGTCNNKGHKSLLIDGVRCWPD